MKNFVYFVESALRGNGLSKETYNILIQMVKEDKDLAHDLHDVLARVKEGRSQYFIDDYEYVDDSDEVQ